MHEPGELRARKELGRLRGEVSFSRQEPVVGGIVAGIRDGDPSTLFLATTDEDGGYRFEGMPPGLWSIVVVREGARSVVKRGVEVKPPARTVLDLTLVKNPGRLNPPVLDLARFEGEVSGPVGGAAGQREVSMSAEAAVRQGEGSSSVGGATGQGGGMAGDRPSARSDVSGGAQTGAVSADGGVVPGVLRVRVHDSGMKPVREARVAIRSRGPRVDPTRGVTDGDGVLELETPVPGEYSLRIEMPGLLPVRVERLLIGRAAPAISVFLAPRPLGFPAPPADLLPEEKPVPPPGFPGAEPAVQ